MAATNTNKYQCEVCGKEEGENNIKMMRCLGCKKFFYCSSECQKKDWPKHKSVCQINGCMTNNADKIRYEDGGLVAMQDIPCGTPVVVDAAAAMHGDILKIEDHRLLKAFEGMSAAQQKKIKRMGYPSKPLREVFIQNSIHINGRGSIILFFDMALMNHSCFPNTDFVLTSQDRPMIVCSTIRDVKRGEKLTYSCATFFNQRIENLEKQFHFKCQCEACESGKSAILDEIGKLASKVFVLEQQPSLANVDYKQIEHIHKTVFIEFEKLNTPYFAYMSNVDRVFLKLFHRLNAPREIIEPIVNRMFDLRILLKMAHVDVDPLLEQAMERFK